MASGAFLTVLRRPGAGRPAAGAAIASVPIGMLGLAVLLLVQRSQGRFAAAGLAVGMLGAGTAVGMLVQGRLIDRFGPTPILLGAAGAQLAAMTGLVVAGRSGAGAAVQVFAFLSGACEPQVNASLRALWPTLLPPPLLPAAMTLSSVLFETTLLLGPLMVTALLLVTEPAGVILLCAVLFAVGTAMVATSRASRAWHGEGQPGVGQPGVGQPGVGQRGEVQCGEDQRRQGGRGQGGRRLRGRSGLVGALAGSGVRMLLLVAAGHGVIIGVVQVSAAARFTGHAGFMYAALSAGSLTGAVVSGTRLQTGRPAWRLAALTAGCAVAVGAASVAAAPVVFAGSLFLVGSCLGPAGVLGYALAGRLAPAGHAVEAFTMITAAGLSTIAVGSALAGVAADRFGSAGALRVAAAGGLLLALLLVGRRRSLVVGW